MVDAKRAKRKLLQRQQHQHLWNHALLVWSVSVSADQEWVCSVTRESVRSCAKLCQTTANDEESTLAF